MLAAGGVLVGLPLYRSLKDEGSLPPARRLVVPLVVVGGCALLASLAPILGVGIAWLAALALAMREAAPRPRGGSATIVVTPPPGPVGPIGVPGGNVPRSS